MSDHEHKHEHDREHDHDHEKHPRILFILLWFFFSIVAFSLCFVAGYGISELIFGVAGRPSELLARIVSGILGLLVFVACAALFRTISEIYRRKYPERKRWRNLAYESSVISNTMEAMNRIAHGDFNVLIPIDENDPHKELAESVNKMVKELSSMENLRQDFISNVSHEIQSPLTSITGFAALLKDPALAQEKRLHYLDIIETESKRLSKLSDNLLNLSSLESDAVPMKHVLSRLDQQIENAVLMLEPQWAEKDLLLSLSTEKTPFVCDGELLTQVWVNLLHNAIKFTPPKGAIDISLKSDEKEVSCTIADSGIGIAAEDRIHLFERFYKVDKSRDRSLGGNGLGLSLVKKIVELHGGSIELKSEVGKGSAFTVRLSKE